MLSRIFFYYVLIWNNFFCLKPNSKFIPKNDCLSLSRILYHFFPCFCSEQNKCIHFYTQTNNNFFQADKSFTHLHSLHFLSSSHTFFSFIIVSNSSWLISMSISAGGIKVSMLLSLLLSIIRILSCFFFLFFVMLSNFFIVPFVREKNNKVNLLLLFQLVLQQHLHMK